MDLVEFIVVKGPNSILREFARVGPDAPNVPGGTGRGADIPAGARAFALGNLPPGRYVVIPMGRDGASLATRPAKAVLVIDDEGQADQWLRFEVIREW